MESVGLPVMFGEFGTLVDYDTQDETVSLMAIKTVNQNLVSLYGGLSEEQVVWEIAKSDLSNPAIGDVINDGDDRWRVRQIIDGDNLVWRLAVTAIP